MGLGSLKNPGVLTGILPSNGKMLGFFPALLGNAGGFQYLGYLALRMNQSSRAKAKFKFCPHKSQTMDTCGTRSSGI